MKPTFRRPSRYPIIGFIQTPPAADRSRRLHLIQNDFRNYAEDENTDKRIILKWILGKRIANIRSG
jgi:hypothetical protein